MDETKRLLRFVLSGCLALLALSLLVQLALRRGGWDRERRSAPAFDPARETSVSAQLEKLLEAYGGMVRAAPAGALPSRDIFLQPDFRPPAQPFVLKAIHFGELELVYRGRIHKSSGEIIAQVNWGARTHFVREGDRVKEWLVARVMDSVLTLRGAQNETLTLRYQTVEKSLQPTALILATASGVEREVSVGDFIEGYKVLEITAEDAPGLPGEAGAVPARGFMPRAGGGPKGRPLTAGQVVLSGASRLVLKGAEPPPPSP